MPMNVRLGTFICACVCDGGGGGGGRWHVEN